ncbi:MAG: mucoidy inhibitor MuiA family protein [Leptospiraceae bacterium]|nr:mucoidy inhibitor MuiA family protein [Leptospiraceae bacterium]
MRRLILCLFLFLILPQVVNAKTEPYKGKIQKVTLYRNQAMVTRNIEVDLPTGEHTLTIQDLPAQIVESSLYAEGEGLDIRAVKIESIEVGKNPEKKINDLDNKIENVRNNIQKIKILQSALKKKINYLTKQEKFITTTEKIELSRGILNTNTMKSMTLFNFEQREKLALDEFKYSLDIKALQKELTLLQKQRMEMNKGTTKKREAIVFVEKKTSGKSSVFLNYLVRDSGWSPLYNIRAKKESNSFELEFNARIHQISGEDWDNIELTLSNASPSLSAVGPGISPFRINLSRNVPQQQIQDLSAVSRSINQKLEVAREKQQEARNWQETQGYNWEMNRAANEYQNLELVADDEDISILNKESESSHSTPSVSYSLKGKVSLASQKDPQLVTVENVKLNGKLYNVATPILTNFVYREAEIENNQVEELLAGSVNVYLDDSFVGNAEIPNVAKGQSFVTGFGIDSQIKTRRALVERKEKILGGNKELDFHIRIYVENFYDKKSLLRVADRIPISLKDGELRVTLVSNTSPLSTDELYVQEEKPKGILRWELEIPGNTSGKKSQVIEYSYKLEFDKNLNINLFNSGNTNMPSGKPADDLLRDEFEQMQKKRYNKK